MILKGPLLSNCFLLRSWQSLLLSNLRYATGPPVSSTLFMGGDALTGRLVPASSVAERMYIQIPWTYTPCMVVTDYTRGASMPDSIHSIHGERGRTLILRNLHWSQALLAIAPGLFLRIAPVAEAPGDPVLELESIKMGLHSNRKANGRSRAKKLSDGFDPHGKFPAPQCVER
jgi:hypothetical protein